MASTQEAVLPVGHVFAGRYRIKSFLGEGDRKRTYLADDTVFPRQVALALIKQDAALGDPEGTHREAEALAQAGRNDNVVTFHDSGTAEGTEYLVFDYLSGGSLREYLAKHEEIGKRLSAEEVMLLGRRLARALAFVHELGLIHRDVAPGNVWLDERHMAHLGDFDSAVARDTALRPAALPPTTEAYTAPEQLSGTFDERSDLYSLGAVLYEALTGRRPKRLPRAAIAKRLTTSRPELPRSLRDAVCSLLAESPDERPASAEEVLEAFEPARVYRKAGEGLVPWADTLPFPLASILWNYEGELEEAGKVDHLIKFFEALAQLAATTLLSACASDRALLEANRSAWFGGEQRPLDLRTATFGLWAQLAGRLSKTLRVVLRGEDGEDRARELFAAFDIELAEALSAAKLTGILHHALTCRNNWTGHGGVAGKHVHRERLRELEDLLAKTRAVLSWSFETWTLLKPGPMIRSGKIYDLTATILKGPNSAFRQRQMKLTEALDTARLYLVNDGNNRALELLPFIRVLAGQTGQDACYFYNRLEGTEVRWVSYHFHAEPELLLPDEGLVDLLTDLGAPYFVKEESDQPTSATPVLDQHLNDVAITSPGQAQAATEGDDQESSEQSLEVTEGNDRERILISVTQGGLDNSYLSLAGNLGFFPKESLGPSNLRDGEGTMLTLHFAGLDGTYLTDIASNYPNFRRRGPWSRFFAHHQIVAGDVVAIERLSRYEYRVFPLTQRGQER